MPTPTTTVRDRVSVLDAALTEVTERLTQTARRLADLDALAEKTERRLARGTMDGEMVAQSATAEFASDTTTVTGRRTRQKRETIAPAQVAAPTPPSTDDLVEAALATSPADVRALAERIGRPVGPVTAALAKLKKARRVFNLGSDVAPRWTLVVGDEAPTPVLYAAVETMLRDRPMTFAELTAATGARRGRLSGVIVQMQRAGRKLANLGTERRARWMLLPE